MFPWFQLSPSSPLMKSMLSLATMELRPSFVDFPHFSAIYRLRRDSGLGTAPSYSVLIVGAANVSTGKLVKFVSDHLEFLNDMIMADAFRPEFLARV
jgi:NTE family protein